MFTPDYNVPDGFSWPDEVLEKSEILFSRLEAIGTEPGWGCRIIKLPSGWEIMWDPDVSGFHLFTPPGLNSNLTAAYVRWEERGQITQYWSDGGPRGSLITNPPVEVLDEAIRLISIP